MTLGDEIYYIMSDAMKKILERTEGHNSARDSQLNHHCQKRKKN